MKKFQTANFTKTCSYFGIFFSFLNVLNFMLSTCIDDLMLCHRTTDIQQFTFFNKNIKVEILNSSPPVYSKVNLSFGGTTISII